MSVDVLNEPLELLLYFTQADAVRFSLTLKTA